MLWICRDCTTGYSVGAPACPHCESTDYFEQGEEPMPKITVHGGPSHADELPATEGGDPFPGNSSSLSETKQSPNERPNEHDDPKPAPTTENRSSKARTAGSTARSTGGSTKADTK